MRQKVQHRMAEVRESVNMPSELGVSFHSDKKRECKRKGKRIYGIRSFAYRIPHPHAAAACRLRLPRIWNPSCRPNPTVAPREVKLRFCFFAAGCRFLLHNVAIFFAKTAS